MQLDSASGMMMTRDIYLNPNYTTEREVYTDLLTDIYELLGLTREQAQVEANNIMQFEIAYANVRVVPRNMWE